MGFREDMKGIFQDVVLDEDFIGQAVTINGASASAVVQFEEYEVEELEDGRRMGRVGRATVSTDALGFSPEIGQEIVIGGVTYKIFAEPVVSEVTGRMVLRFRRSSSVDKGRRGFGIR